MYRNFWRSRQLLVFAAVAALTTGTVLPAGATTVGTLSVLTYNVAGLPLGLSSSTPELNTVLISPLLNGFDLVAVQEDFGFHAELISQVTHPHLSIKDQTDSQAAIDFGLNLGLGDGLNRMSGSAFIDFQRVTWDACFGLLTNGSDCLAPKGFSVARHELLPGQFIDVYNLHADAGSTPDDQAVRRDQLRQLAAFMQVFSANQAVVVLGDTNSRYTRAGDILPELLASTGLTDVWVDLMRAGSAPAIGPKLGDCIVDGQSGGDCEHIDKVFFRSGSGIDLVAAAYQVLDLEFVDGAGIPLSDHDPVSVVFQFASVPEPGTGLLLAIGFAGIVSTRRARRAGLQRRAAGA